jgi:hypothetical protein
VKEEKEEEGKKGKGQAFFAMTGLKQSSLPRCLGDGRRAAGRVAAIAGHPH